MIFTGLIDKDLTRLLQCSCTLFYQQQTVRRLLSSNMNYKVILFIVVASVKIIGAGADVQEDMPMQSYTDEQLRKLSVESISLSDKRAIYYNLVPFGKEFYHDPEGSASYQSTRYIHALLYVMRGTQTLIQTTERLYRNVRDNMNKCKPYKYVN